MRKPSWRRTRNTQTARAIRSVLGVEQLETRAVPAGIPVATLNNLPASPLIGEQATFTVQFDNADPADTGYGPYVDLYLPATGADGAGAATDDGVSFVSATYLGSPVPATVITLTAAGVPHPYARGPDGAPLIIYPPPGFQEGDQLVVLELPFGSFAPGQTPADITVTTSVSPLADLGTALPVTAVGGFRYGNDPLDNPSADPSIVGTTTSSTITPELIRMEKRYIGPEDETATGPNYVRQYQLVVDIANGQTVTDLDLTDLLPDDLQFVSVISVTNVGPAATVTTIATPGTTVPGGTLTRRLSAVTGGPGTDDAVLTFSFYAPLQDAGGTEILGPNTGQPVTTTNTGTANGTWDPLDSRDPLTPATATDDHTLTLRSLATQKTAAVVNDSGTTGPTPGDTIEYTINVQVSDYFAFANLILTDLVPDGMSFDNTFVPTLVVSEHGVNTSSPFTPVNFTVSPAAGADTLTFRVGDQLVTLGQDNILPGGNIPPGGIVTPQSAPPLFSPGTTLTIRYRAIINDTYDITPPSGDNAVKSTDVLTNAVTVSGTVLNRDTLNPVPLVDPVTDGSDADIVIPRGTATKSVYAINGAAPAGTPPQVTPGDLVTYRITLDLPTTSFQNLVLTDYLPLPLFQAGPVTFNPIVSGTAPAVNFAQYGPSDTSFAVTGITPTVTPNGTSNSLAFNLGTFNDTQNRSTKLDILFTVLVTNDPFADLLYLTNQITTTQTTSDGSTDSSTAITPVQSNEPVVPAILKGVVATDNPAGQLTLPVAGPIVFSAPGTPGTRFSGGIINSTYLVTTPLNSDLTGVDAGDRVTFAVIIGNNGSSPNGAFDVSIRDTLPAGFVIPTSGLNLQVTDGTGAVFSYIDLGGGLFGSGIELVDPGPTANPPALWIPDGTRTEPGRNPYRHGTEHCHHHLRSRSRRYGHSQSVHHEHRNGVHLCVLGRWSQFSRRISTFGPRSGHDGTADGHETTRVVRN